MSLVLLFFTVLSFENSVTFSADEEEAVLEPDQADVTPAKLRKGRPGSNRFLMS